MSQEKNWVPQPKSEGGNYNEVWKPTQDGDTIEGTLVKSQSNVGPNNQWVYDIKVADGTVFSVWGKQVLDGQLSTVPVNSYIKIEFIGKKTSKKGNTFYDFNVFVAGEQAPAPVADVAATDPALTPQPAQPAQATPAPQAEVPVAAPAPTADVPVATPPATNAPAEDPDDLPF
ncbi:MAG: hypothetical protein QQN63_13330 [Nitrosopumilus sp.]